MEINRGMQMAIQALIKMMGLDPVRVQNSIEEIGKSLQSAASDMATIRRQNTAIMAHLGIADFNTGDCSDGQIEHADRANGKHAL